MKRRQLIQRFGALGAAALAGCGGSNRGGGEPPAEQTTEGPRLVDSEFSVSDQSTGDQNNEATISFESDTVVVEGTIWGSNGCKTAELRDATYDADADQLSVEVGTKDRDDGADACTMVIVTIDYKAVFSFEGGLPGSVDVTHDSGEGPTEVATASR